MNNDRARALSVGGGDDSVGDLHTDDCQQTDCMRFTVSVVLPAFNEEGNIDLVCRMLTPVLSQYPEYEILFVDDGSTDGTLAELREAHMADARVHYLSLSRNFGHQPALKAGIDHAIGDCVVTMDCDLQHPPELVPTMVGKWLDGFDVVYTVRLDDQRLPLLKRVTSRAFYGLMNKLAEVRVEPGAADFRLLDRQVVETMRPINERSLFLRGLVPWVGFSQVAIPYSPAARHSGQTKYSLGRMTRFAIDGVSSFSAKPLQWSSFGGCVVSVAAAAYGAFAVIAHLLTNRTTTGWTSLMVALLLLGGIQLLATGILGTYIGKLFLDSKPRPIYIIKECHNDNIPAPGSKCRMLSRRSGADSASRPV